MEKKGWILVSVLFVLGLFSLFSGIDSLVVLGGTIQAGAQCNETVACTCGDVLNGSKIFNESDVLTGCTGTALYIGSNHVQLDCNGTVLSGDGTGSGINIRRHINGANITNCTINGFNYGINNTVGGNYSLINDNEITNTSAALRFYQNFNLTITNNTLSNSTYGIYLLNSTSFLIRSNQISSHVIGGIYLKYSDGFGLYNVLDNPRDYNNSYGFDLQDGNYTIIGNNVTNYNSSFYQIYNNYVGTLIANNTLTGFSDEIFNVIPDNATFQGNVFECDFSSGFSMIFVSGDSFYSSNVDIDASNTINGKGIYFYNSTNDIQTVTNASFIIVEFAENVTVSDSTDISMVWFRNVNNSYVRNNNFSAGDTNIDIHTSLNLTISDNIFNDCLYCNYYSKTNDSLIYNNTVINSAYGFYLQYINNLNFSDNLILSSINDQRCNHMHCNCFYSIYSDNLTIENNDLSCAETFWSLSSSGFRLAFFSNATIIGNTISNCPKGFLFEDVYSSQFIHNTIYLNASQQGIYTAPLKGILHSTIKDNSIYGGSVGVYLAKAGRGTVPLNNSILNNTINGASMGIYLSSTQSHIIANNTITNITCLFGPEPCAGIYLTTTSALNNISGNNLSYISNASILVEATCTNTIITRNHLCRNRYGVTNNSVGLLGFGNNTFCVDIISPASGTTTAVTSPAFSFNASKMYLDGSTNCTLDFGSSSNSDATIVHGTIETIYPSPSLTTLSTYSWNISCDDGYTNTGRTGNNILYISSTCGDSKCEGNETCSTCAQDCGQCMPVGGSGSSTSKLNPAPEIKEEPEIPIIPSTGLDEETEAVGMQLNEAEGTNLKSKFQDLFKNVSLSWWMLGTIALLSLITALLFFLIKKNN
ncbi:right-handed parallel beta-helix repeat-containing protein [Candidatus Woesearchaeota archaeon]|nr:right-handed parallel beta-helix repeat-containing protein [Candidatus Woesearchaeota archaeon]